MLQLLMRKEEGRGRDGSARTGLCHYRRTWDVFPVRYQEWLWIKVCSR